MSIIVMNIEFIIFPNNETFLQRAGDGKEKHYKIKDIYIMENGSFWFETYKSGKKPINNMNHKYVHINSGEKSIEELSFTKEPFVVTRDNFKFDPKNKRLIIGESIIPWKKPLWTRNVQGAYIGAEIPKKNTKIQGDWLLDRNERKIYLILDYAPIIRTNKFKNT